MDGGLGARGQSKEREAGRGETGQSGEDAGGPGLGSGVCPSPAGSAAHDTWLRGPSPAPEGEGALAQMSPGLCLFFPGVPSACKQVVSVETTRDIEWATYTCTLGFHVFGEFPTDFVWLKWETCLLESVF